MEYRAAYGGKRLPVIRWWHHDNELNEVERKILDALAECNVVLDVGAGDLRLKDKLQAHGLQARYLTQNQPPPRV